MKCWRRLIGSQDGFIPMLLALLIAAAGLIGVGAIILRASTAGLQNSKSSVRQLVYLEKAIRVQVFLNGTLPCPAHGDGDGTAKPDCTANNNDGVVPWTTLGVTREDATDPYGRLISYHVDPDLVAGNICTGAIAKPGTLRLNPSTKTSLFALISHGPNGLGGWLPIRQQMAIPASTLERENCSDSVSNATVVRCSNPDAKDIGQGPHQADPAKANYFDDITLAARSADYDAVCAAAHAGGPPGGPGVTQGNQRYRPARN